MTTHNHNDESDDMEALRHLIGNAAHDLKTPLASFMTGTDIIMKTVQAMEEIIQESSNETSPSHYYHIQEKQQLSSPDQLHHLHHHYNTPQELSTSITTIKACLQDIMNTNQFMLMSINRCIDYTKSSDGLKLKPKYDTLDVIDALRLPIICMRNTQESCSLYLNPLPEELCSHIITDKQWLQENVLCLLSNAVKYSSGGDVSVTVSLEEAEVAVHSLTMTSGGAADVSRMRTPSNNYHNYNTSHDDNTSTNNVDINDLDANKTAVWNHTSNATAAHGSSGQQTSYLSELGASSVDSVMDNNNVTTDNSRHTTSNSNSSDSSTTNSQQLQPAVVRKNTHFLRVEVQDSGIGVPEHARANLFHPFKQTQKLAGGTGLGLYSLAKRVEALGGTFGVVGRRDGLRGSIFYFTIPYRPDWVAHEAFLAEQHTNTATNTSNVIATNNNHDTSNYFYTVQELSGSHSPTAVTANVSLRINPSTTAAHANAETASHHHHYPANNNDNEQTEKAFLTLEDRPTALLEQMSHTVRKIVLDIPPLNLSPVIIHRDNIDSNHTINTTTTNINNTIINTNVDLSASLTGLSHKARRSYSESDADLSPHLFPSHLSPPNNNHSNNNAHMKNINNNHHYMGMGNHHNLFSTNYMNPSAHTTNYNNSSSNFYAYNNAPDSHRSEHAAASSSSSVLSDSAASAGVDSIFCRIPSSAGTPIAFVASRIHTTSSSGQHPSSETATAGSSPTHYYGSGNIPTNTTTNTTTNIATNTTNTRVMNATHHSSYTLGRILLVEDSQTIGKMTVALLQRQGFSVTWVMNGALALDKLCQLLPHTISSSSSSITNTVNNTSSNLQADPLHTNNAIDANTSSSMDAVNTTSTTTTNTMLNGRMNEYDVVLMDLQMPIMDGLEATKRFRDFEDAHFVISSPAHNSATTNSAANSSATTNVAANNSNDSVNHHYRRQLIVGLSANSDRETMDAARANGFDDFMEKPINVNVLLSILGKSPRHHVPQPATPPAHSPAHSSHTNSNNSGTNTNITNNIITNSNRTSIDSSSDINDESERNNISYNNNIHTMDVLSAARQSLCANEFDQTTHSTH